MLFNMHALTFMNVFHYACIAVSISKVKHISQMHYTRTCINLIALLQYQTPCMLSAVMIHGSTNVIIKVVHDLYTKLYMLYTKIFNTLHRHYLN